MPTSLARSLFTNRADVPPLGGLAMAVGFLSAVAQIHDGSAAKSSNLSSGAAAVVSITCSS
jgi:hypothetical protein